MFRQFFTCLCLPWPMLLLVSVLMALAGCARPYALTPVVRDDVEAFFDTPGAASRDLSYALPPVPTESSVVRINLGSAGERYKFGVDARSIMVAPNDVVRYAIWSAGPSGKQSARYEGIRCSTGERRLYAWTRSNNWALVKNSPWQNTAASGNHKLQQLLFEQVFCSANVAAGTSEEISYRLLTLEGRMKRGS